MNRSHLIEQFAQTRCLYKCCTFPCSPWLCQTFRIFLFLSTVCSAQIHEVCSVIPSCLFVKNFSQRESIPLVSRTRTKSTVRRQTVEQFTVKDKQTHLIRPFTKLNLVVILSVCVSLSLAHLYCGFICAFCVWQVAIHSSKSNKWPTSMLAFLSLI